MSEYLSTTSGGIRDDFLELAEHQLKAEQTISHNNTFTTSTLQHKKPSPAPPFVVEHSEVAHHSSEESDVEEPPIKLPAPSYKPTTARYMDCVRKWGLHFAGNKSRTGYPAISRILELMVLRINNIKDLKT